MHSPRARANAPVQPLAVSATPGPGPIIGEKILKSRFSEDEAGSKNHGTSTSILSNTAGIVDTGTTLTLISTGTYLFFQHRWLYRATLTAGMHRRSE